MKGAERGLRFTPQNLIKRAEKRMENAWFVYQLPKAFERYEDKIRGNIKQWSFWLNVHSDKINQITVERINTLHDEFLNNKTLPKRSVAFLAHMRQVEYDMIRGFGLGKGFFPELFQIQPDESLEIHPMFANAPRAIPDSFPPWRYGEIGGDENNPDVSLITAPYGIRLLKEVFGRIAERKKLSRLVYPEEEMDALMPILAMTDMAFRQQSRVVGLGASLPSLTKMGELVDLTLQWLKKTKYCNTDVSIPEVVTGHHTTVHLMTEMAHDFLEKAGVRSYKNIPIMVVGACGSIGRAVTENLLSDSKMDGRVIVLRDTNSKKLEQLKDEYIVKYQDRNITFIVQEVKRGEEEFVVDDTKNDFIVDVGEEKKKVGIVLSAVTSDKILLTKDAAERLAQQGHHLVYIEDSQPDTVEAKAEEHLAIVNVLARIPALAHCNYNFGHANPNDLFGCLVEAYTYNQLLERIDELKSSKQDQTLLERLEGIKLQINGKYGRGIMGRVEMNTSEGIKRMQAVKEMYDVIGEDVRYKLEFAPLQHCGMLISDEVKGKTYEFLKQLDTSEVSN